jgi:hypothetical protein
VIVPGATESTCQDEKVPLLLPLLLQLLLLLLLCQESNLRLGISEWYRQSRTIATSLELPVLLLLPFLDQSRPFESFGQKEKPKATEKKTNWN